MSKDMAAAFERAEREVAELIRNLDISNADHVALWLDAHLGHVSEHLPWVASRIVDAHQAAARRLSEDIVRLRGFIQSINDDWVKNDPAGDDEWNDGYEDCLTDYAAKARKILAGASLDEVLS